MDYKQKYLSIKKKYLNLSGGTRTMRRSSMVASSNFVSKNNDLYKPLYDYSKFFDNKGSIGSEDENLNPIDFIEKYFNQEEQDILICFAKKYRNFTWKNIKKGLLLEDLKKKESEIDKLPKRDLESLGEIAYEKIDDNYVFDKNRFFSKNEKNNEKSYAMNKKNDEIYKILSSYNLVNVNVERKALIDILMKKNQGDAIYETSGNNELTSDLDYSFHYKKPVEEVISLSDETKKKKIYYLPYREYVFINNFFQLIFNKSSGEQFDINFYSHSYYFPQDFKLITIPTPNTTDKFHIEFSEVMRNYENIERRQEFFAVLKIYNTLKLSENMILSSTIQHTDTFQHIGINYLKQELQFNISSLKSISLLNDIIATKENENKEKLKEEFGKTLVTFKELDDYKTLINQLVKDKYELSENDKIKILFDYYEINPFFYDPNKNMYIKVLREMNSKIANIYAQKDNKRLDNILIERDKYHLVNLISLSAPFSDESYYTYGALMHVVYLRQKTLNIVLSKEFYIHSMLENFADFIHKIGDDLTNKYEIIVDTSKYIARIYDAIMLYYSGNHSEYLSKFTSMDFISSTFRRNTEFYKCGEYKLSIDKTLNKYFNLSKNFLLEDLINKIIQNVSAVYIEFCREKGFQELVKFKEITKGEIKKEDTFKLNKAVSLDNFFPLYNQTKDIHSDIDREELETYLFGDDDDYFEDDEGIPLLKKNNFEMSNRRNRSLALSDENFVDSDDE